MRFVIRILILTLFTITTISVQAQCLEDSLNMQKLYQYDDPNQPGIYNDVWGYVAPDGREYGIMGSSDSILIFDVTDVNNIYKVDALQGDGSCSWRDMKTLGEYLYAGSECGDGLLVFDLSDLPNSFSRVNKITSEFSSSHNIYIDTTSSRLYAVGMGGGANIVVYDIGTTPSTPTLLKELAFDTLPNEAVGGNYYIHDIFVRNDTAYCSHGDPGYIIWDFTDLNNISRVSQTVQLPAPDLPSYVHSSWNTADNKYAYVATEIGNRQIYIINQTDINNPVLDTTWREPLLQSCSGGTTNNNNIPHNPYIHEGLLYISYYQDGVNILDITERREPFRLGFYELDTTNVSYTGTRSNWGVYPFLPSGTIIASDTRNGFFALRYNAPDLPIELRSFDVKPGAYKSSAQIDWAVASAINVSDFELQRSRDGIHFETVYEVDYYSQDNDYQFVDEQLTSGLYYYRLRTNDYDASFMYSEVKRISIKNDVVMSIIPTASNGDFLLKVSESGSWSYNIMDSTGKLIDTNQFDGKEKQFDMRTLSSGIYFITMNNGQDQFQSNFIILD